MELKHDPGTWMCYIELPLIVPYGIETAPTCILDWLRHQPLIVPYGIETIKRRFTARANADL